jgi:hypothetical protein
LAVGKTRITTTNRTPTNPFGNSTFNAHNVEFLPQVLGDLIIDIQEDTDPPPEPQPTPDPPPEPELEPIVSSPDKPTVILIAGDETAGENGDMAWYTVKRIGDNTRDLVVNLRLSGTAVEGRDYATIGASVTVPRAQSEVRLEFKPVDDSLVEGNETVIISILSGTAYQLGATISLTATIQDNDATPPQP